jgi:hypothetical protein
MASPPPTCQRESYSLLNSKRLARANCPSLPENITHRTKCLAPSFVPIIWGYVRFGLCVGSAYCLLRRACVNSALSAFRSPLWSFNVRLVGGVSSGTTPRPPRSVPGRTIQPNLLFSACHRLSQSWRTSFFSCQSHWLSGSPIHSSTCCFRSTLSVVAGCALAWRQRFVRLRILVLIVLQASLIFYAIPKCSILA